MFATVVLSQNNTKVAGTETDIDGNYFFQNITPGTYDIEASMLGYKSTKVTGVLVKAGKVHRVDIQLDDDPGLLDVVAVREYKTPLIAIDNTTSGATVTAEKIKNLGTNNKAGLRSRVEETTNDDQSRVQVRGSRSPETVYFVDGVRVTGSPPNDESYATLRENSFSNVDEESLSTFALDVDRAAYSNIRRMINLGAVPPPDAVRIEEMVNYFSYQYAPPGKNEVMDVHSVVTDCPWNKGLKLLHLGVQSRKAESELLPPSNLVFLIDVSGSMHDVKKLPLVISSLKLLVNQLRPEDRVAIVTYAGNAGIALPSVSAAEKVKILDVLDGLTSGGSTAGAEGIVTAYKIAAENFIPGGNNRVILATDGDFNVGISDNTQLEKLIEEKKNTGVFLTVLGFGMGNYKDDKMQILADKGNGNHAYIDDLQEANKVLVNEFGATLFTLAKDVKFQVEFNPAVVSYFRLLGYENRMLAKEDFNDDSKDGGELGMGHQMTAIYELILANDDDALVLVDPLKYREAGGKQKNKLFSDELATIKFRYKEPKGLTSRKWEKTITHQVKPLEILDEDVRFSIAVAYAGMLLRQFSTLENNSFNKMLELAESSKGPDADGYRAEFVRLMKLVSELKKQM